MIDMYQLFAMLGNVLRNSLKYDISFGSQMHPAREINEPHSADRITSIRKVKKSNVNQKSPWYLGYLLLTY